MPHARSIAPSHDADLSPEALDIPKAPESGVRLSVAPAAFVAEADEASFDAPRSVPETPWTEAVGAAFLLAAASIPAVLLGGQPLRTIRALASIVALTAAGPAR
jgi:hypothetical protein